jgi:hypothetical protein
MGGYVYAIANDAMPGLVKIGATLRNPEDRLNEARATTWAPSCFRIIAQAAVGDAFGTERTLHALLARRRFDGRREFFVMTHEEAIALLALVVPSAVPSASAEAVHPSPEERLRAWVDANYTRIPLREKDSGTKLEALHGAYIASAPPVHQKVLGRNLFAKMLEHIYPGIGAHRGHDGSRGIYLLR